MRIAFDAKRALNNASGLGNYSRNLLNALMQYFPNEEYLLFSPEAKDEFFHQLNGDFKMVFPETKLGQFFHPLWRSSGIKNQLIKDRVDIYHGLSNEVPFDRQRSTFRNVVSIHDLIFLKHKEQYPFFDRRFYQLKTKYAVKHTDRIIAVSNETKQDLMEFYGAPEQKIEVIYPLINSAFQEADNGELAVEIQKYNLPAQYILHVGSFFPRKNQRKIIEAFDLVKNKLAHDLILVGDAGNQKREVEALIAKRNLQSRVKIITGVPNEHLPAIYRAAGLFVYPSLYEGFGMPIVEALFSKVPVITTKGGCFEEAGGKYTVYINPELAEEIAEVMLKVLSDETRKIKIIEAGYAHAQTMTGKIIAEKMMSVYQQLMS